MRLHFQTVFSQRFFCVFCARVKDSTLKSYWKPNTSVILSTSCILPFLKIHFGAFLLLYGLVSNIFTFFFSWVQKYVWKDVIHMVVWLFKKIKQLYLREFCKRTHCPPSVILALLLFIPCWFTFSMLHCSSAE